MQHSSENEVEWFQPLVDLEVAENEELVSHVVFEKEHFEDQFDFQATECLSEPRFQHQNVLFFFGSDFGDECVFIPQEFTEPVDLTENVAIAQIVLLDDHTDVQV